MCHIHEGLATQPTGLKQAADVQVPDTTGNPRVLMLFIYRLVTVVDCPFKCMTLSPAYFLGE